MSASETPDDELSTGPGTIIHDMPDWEPIETSETPDTIKRLADEYAHVYSFVKGKTMPIKRAELHAAIDDLESRLRAAQLESCALKGDLHCETVRAEAAERERDELKAAMESARGELPEFPVCVCPASRGAEGQDCNAPDCMGDITFWAMLAGQTHNAAAAAIASRDASIAELRELLQQSTRHVFAHAAASHLTEGFHPKRNEWDELADKLRAKGFK